jgi:DNA-binding MarR family transcriptional regulator
VVRNLGFQKSLLNKLFRLSAKLEQELETDLKVSFSLTFSQFRLLEALSTVGEASQKTLAEKMGVTPAIVTRQAEALASRGLLTQVTNPASRRENLLKITDRGGRAVIDAGMVVTDCQRRVFGALDLRQETALKHALDELITIS